MDYVAVIKEKGMTGKLIAQLINEHTKDSKRMKSQYERYKTDDVPVFRRSSIQTLDFETDRVKRIDNKVNNRLNNSFDSEIVDTKVGYMFGIPIAYDVDKEQANSEALLEQVRTFNLRNSVEDKDSEWGKKAAICGYATRLCYIDFEGNERIMNVNPWETILLSETDNIAEPTYAIRYYDKSVGEGTEHVAIFYDNNKAYRFVADAGGYNLREEKRHLFEYCPLFGLPNNEELQGDAEKVYRLIDAYDRTLSDASNEIEQYRLAYLVLRGMGMDEEDMEEMNRNGMFQLMGEKDELKYLTKDINDDLIEHHLDRLEENILRLAKSVNFGDGTFGTTVTGVALRYKLLALESKCMTMERKTVSALRYQFKVLCSSWGKRSHTTKEDYLQVFFTFKRNIPVDLLSEAQASTQLQGQVSERTRLAALSIVDDPQYELDEMLKETEGIRAIDLEVDD